MEILEVIFELLFWLLSAVFWLIYRLVVFVCHVTALVLLPLVSLGRLRVLAKSQSAAPPLQRLPSGYIGVRYDSACLIGFLIWGMVIVIAGLDFRY